MFYNSLNFCYIYFELHLIIDHSYYIQLAIDEALKSEEPLKCGAVIVKDGEIIAVDFNKQRSIPDITAHAEINVLRKACKQLNSKNLSGCILYGTCEPCLMCLSAIIWANISQLYYSVPLIDATYNSSRNIKISSLEFVKRSDSNLQIFGGILKDTTFEKLYLTE